MTGSAHLLLLLLLVVIEGQSQYHAADQVAAARWQQQQKPWTERHIALSDRSVNNWNSTKKLDNIWGPHSLGFTTDSLQCPWNVSSADPYSPCISSSPADILAAIKAENTTWQRLDEPRIFTLDSIFDPSLPNSNTWGWTDQSPSGFYTPFLARWTAGLKERVTRWFTEFKRLGGRVDVVLLDLEACDYLNAGRMAMQVNSQNQTGFGAEVVTMAAWPALRQELEVLGKPYGASFSDDDMAAMAHWRENQTDFRAYVWDAVVVSHRTARALNESIAAPIIRLFPSVKISNYAHNYYSPPTRDDPPEITNWGCEPFLPLSTSCARRARERSPLCCVSTPATRL